MHDPRALKIHIDGSAFRNPGHEGGLAGIAEFPESLARDPEVIFQESFDGTTNNRMELKACIRSLEWVEDNSKPLGFPRVIILSDSKYVTDNHRLVPSWRKNGWRNRHGRPIENKELWRKFLSVRSRIRVILEITWSAGKSTAISKLVDRLAKESAKAPLKTKDSGYQPGKVSRHRTDERGAALLFPANNQKAIIKVYAHDPASKNECKVRFLIFREDENRFMGKYAAYIKGPQIADIHRHSRYKVLFNDSPEYPVFQIVETLHTKPQSAKPEIG